MQGFSQKNPVYDKCFICTDARCLPFSVSVGEIAAQNIFYNPFTAVGAHRELIDFTLSNARRVYSSMENPLGVKGLILKYSSLSYNE